MIAAFDADMRRRVRASRMRGGNEFTADILRFGERSIGVEIPWSFGRFARIYPLEGGGITTIWLRVTGGTLLSKS